MWTFGPAMSLSTWLSGLQQKEHRSWDDVPVRRPSTVCTKSLITTSPKPSPLVLGDYVVDDAVLDSLVGTHYVVAVGVALDPVVGLARVGREDLVEASLGHNELLGVDLHVGGLTRQPADARLVQQDARVRERVPLALGPRREQERPQDRKSTRLNSSHANISYAVFCLKKKITLPSTHRR